MFNLVRNLSNFVVCKQQTLFSTKLETLNVQYIHIIFAYQISKPNSKPCLLHLLFIYCRIRIPISCMYYTIGYIGVVIVSDRALRFDGKIVTRRKIYVLVLPTLAHTNHFWKKIPPATNLQTCK